MASSLQERLHLNRLPLDKWTTREQLCLASAVSCSGDQNWMSVSRALKLVCGIDGATRPSDWYSQKNCAVQYGHLLENVETPKRKKRSNDSASGVASPAPVETPTDVILRRLTEERVQELKSEIRQRQEEYAQIYNELKALKTAQLTEEQLLQMWCDIEKQQENQRIKEMKLENQMREREQQRQEMQRNWRTVTAASPSNISATVQKPSADTTNVDMDVEEIIGASGLKAVSGNMGQPQTQHIQQSGTSPLLSSLLKSPTTAGNGAPIFPSAVSVTALGNSARATAPTITTLLTSGSIPNSNQPAIKLNSNISPQEAVQLLTRPISGPPADPSMPVTTAAAQDLLSPSQAAPTLSMLLEKTKATVNNQVVHTVNIDERENESPSETQRVETIVPSGSNNEEVPMDLEDDININPEAAHDSDEPDPNEEQQLLEVFKNIGNIDELDIDVSAVIEDAEIDFLKGVDEKSPHESTDVIDFDDKVERELAEMESESEPETTNIEIKKETAEMLTELCNNKADDSKKSAEVNNDKSKVERISSDDDDDNIPLAALEQKSVQEKDISKEGDELVIRSEADFNTDSNKITLIEDTPEKEQIEDNKNFDEVKNVKFTSETSSVKSENSDVIVIPTDDESSREKQSQEQEKPAESVNNLEMTVGTDFETRQSNVLNESETAKSLVGTNELKEMSEMNEIQFSTDSDAVVPAGPTSISIADTDEDSSTTDVSISARKEDRGSASAIKHLIPQARKSLHDTRHEQKTDDESNARMSSSSSSSITQAKPLMVRKLRERDRSESPLIEAELSTSMSTATGEHLSGQRLRRRYSSAPVTDSVPNSPASSDRDEVENRTSKKLLLSVYNAVQCNKNFSVLQSIFQEHAKLENVCLRHLDMSTLKKNIESGAIRTITELQRDVMLMGQNAVMLSTTNSNNHKSAEAFMLELKNIREFASNPNTTKTVPKSEVKDAKDGSKTAISSSNKSRSGSRKSQRIL